MNDWDSPEWELAEHLKNGVEALECIAAIRGDESAVAPVCHHFWSELDPMEVHFTNHFTPSIIAFAEHGVDLDPSSLEAWEEVAPTIEWLHERVPTMLKLATIFDLHYSGWSWEPRRGKGVNASQIEIIDNLGGA